MTALFVLLAPLPALVAALWSASRWAATVLWLLAAGILLALPRSSAAR